LYDIRPGNGAGPFLQPRSPHCHQLLSNWCLWKNTNASTVKNKASL